MRRFIRFNSGPLLLLSIVSALALGTFVLRRILSVAWKPAGGEAPPGDSSPVPGSETDGGTGSTVSDAPPQPDGGEPAVPPEQPANGTVFVSPSSGCIAPLTVQVAGPDNCYIYLKAVGDGGDIPLPAQPGDMSSGCRDIGFYASAGSSVSLDVPVGVYSLSYAVGGQWRGLGDKFGPDTRYYRTDQHLTFRVDGSLLHGNTVRLFPPLEGASSQHLTDAAGFPG